MGLIADQTHPKTELVNLEDISVETTHNSTWKIKTKENTEEWIRYKKKKKNTARWPENIPSKQ